MNVREIAKLANVSIATVSRVINRPDVVLPETREHVLAIMREHNYAPALDNRKNKNITATNIILMVPGGGGLVSQQLMSGLESVANRRNYTVFMCNSGNGAGPEERLLQAVLEQRTAGIVMVNTSLSPAAASMLQSAQTPLVMVGRKDTAIQYNTCYINYEEGAYRLVRHLLELGHKKMLLLCGETERLIEQTVLQGARRAFFELQTPGCELLPTVFCRSGVEGGYRAAAEILENRHLDAVFASNDDLAFGLMEALRERNIGVPSSLAVAGFSDSPAATVVEPKLTTVEQPNHKLGMVAARILFDLIDDDYPDSVPQEIVLLPKLKIRNSCGNKKPINTLFE